MYEKEKRHITAVWQKLGISAILNILNSNEHYAKFEHSYF